MSPDEQAIRDVISTWMQATARDDLTALLPLMAEDAVFLVAGQPPMRGRTAFAAAFEANMGRVRIEASAAPVEIHVAGNFAYCWNQLEVTMTPTSGDAAPGRRSGPVLTIYRREPDGRWVLFRDANLLAPEGARPGGAGGAGG